MSKKSSEADPDNPPRRGRRKLKFIVRGKAALNDAFNSLLRRPSPTLAPDAPGPEAAGGGVPLSEDQAREALLAGEQYGVTSERDDINKTPLMLQTINREAEGYKLLDTINTEDLLKWFHNQPKGHSESRVAKLTWFGHPGDSPHNIRARKFVFEVTADNLAVVKIWQKGEHKDAAPDQWTFLISLIELDGLVPKLPQLRGFLLPNSSGVAERLTDYRIPTQKQVRGMIVTSKQRTRMARNPFRATWLMVKRNPQDLYYHTRHNFEAPDSKSEFTVGITDNFSLDSTILNTEAPNGTIFLDSTHRLHNENRAATTVLCTANEGKHVMPGAYLISANIQAQTIKNWFVQTIQKVEARAKEIAAGKSFLSAFVVDKSKIHHRDPPTTNRLSARCQRIAANGKFDFTNINIDKSRSEYNGIVEALYNYLPVLRLLFKPSSSSGLQTTTSGSANSTLSLPSYDSRCPGAWFSVTVKAQILILFRVLQRCRSMDHWEAAKRTFHAGLVELLGEADRDTMAADAAAERVSALHPEDNDNESEGVAPAKSRSKPLFTDIGMPPGQSRDDTWNTNNWAETAFKQFNTVFLDNKHNKRIDQLASVILNHHLPYFRFFPTPDRTPAKAFVQLNDNANRIWETEMVSPSGQPEEFIVKRVIDHKPVQKTVVLTPLSCTCDDYMYSGKACVDILAARILRKNGPNANWKVVEAETESPAARAKPSLSKSKSKPKSNSQSQTKSRSKLKGKAASKANTQSDGPRTGKLPNDATIEAELDTVFSKLRQFDENEKEQEPEPMNELRLWGLAYRAVQLEQLRRHRMRGASAPSTLPPSPSPPPPPPPPPPLPPPLSPNDNDQFLNAEDLALANLENVFSWLNPTYKLRLDEVAVFVALLNNSVIAIEEGFVFLAGPPRMGIRDHLRRIDWSQPLTVLQTIGPRSTILCARTRRDLYGPILSTLLRKTTYPPSTYNTSGFCISSSCREDSQYRRCSLNLFRVTVFHGFSLLLDFNPCNPVINVHEIKRLLSSLNCIWAAADINRWNRIDQIRPYEPRRDFHWASSVNSLLKPKL
ncbi:hypothetical protein R3P38DRAFT_2788427 [Favolaschia claudopus]|uniref:SWIM-type domain-containing protein n=1 Tax=Favolaschia claudopus TaxID=2862362 RepID=A0AAW0AKW1_9AGAR